jgi:hypothetical protein
LRPFSGKGKGKMEERLRELLYRRDELVPSGYKEKPGEEVVMAEIAGRDSIGAVVALARGGGLKRVLPTIVFTGTEYGDIESLAHNAGGLRHALKDLGVEVMETAVLGSPRWWNAVIGRVNSILTRRYGPWHICIGCHMYLHAVRVPLARKVGARKVVAGERLSHEGRIKVNQTQPAVEAYRRVLEEWGVELAMPLLKVREDAEILELTGEWGEGTRQPQCALSGNYRDLMGEADVDEEGVRAYLHEYLIPVTSRILEAIEKQGRADYLALVKEVLA